MTEFDLMVCKAAYLTAGRLLREKYSPVPTFLLPLEVYMHYYPFLNINTPHPRRLSLSFIPLYGIF